MTICGKWIGGVMGLLLLMTGSARTARSPASIDVPAARQWRVTLAESDGTEIVFYATLRFPSMTQWEMYSREGAARSQVSWW